MLNRATVLFILSTMIFGFSLVSSSYAASTGAINRGMIVVSEDGVAKAIIPANTVCYSDSARKKRVEGTIAAHVYSLKGIPSANTNMPNAPGF